MSRAMYRKRQQMRRELIEHQRVERARRRIRLRLQWLALYRYGPGVR
jgi:hypothetical protein